MGKIRKIFLSLLFIFFVIVLVISGINFRVRNIAENKIMSMEEIMTLADVDCILVLGAGVKGGKPSPVLEDRLQRGIELYNKNIAGKIIMSGDHGRKEYDEVNAMKDFAIDKGVSSEDIFMDHAGFSTYESIYRAKEIFQADKIVIVTQKYHLYRALYIADSLGIEAYGMDATTRDYGGELYREAREIIARNKDFVKCMFKPKPTYLGEIIPVNGNGNVTDD